MCTQALVGLFTNCLQITASVRERQLQLTWVLLVWPMASRGRSRTIAVTCNWKGPQFHSMIQCVLHTTLMCTSNQAPLTYDERRWFANRWRRPRGPKHQRPRGRVVEIANWRCCRNRNPLKSNRRASPGKLCDTDRYTEGNGLAKSVSNNPYYIIIYRKIWIFVSKMNEFWMI